MRQDGLPAGTRIAADQTLDVDRRLADEPKERVVPVLVLEPAIDAQRFLRPGFVALRDRILENLLLRGGQWPNLVEEAFDGRRVPVRLHERVERLNEMPG